LRLHRIRQLDEGLRIDEPTLVQALQAAEVVARSAGDMLKVYLAKQAPLSLRKGGKGKGKRDFNMAAKEYAEQLKIVWASTCSILLGNNLGFDILGVPDDGMSLLQGPPDLEGMQLPPSPCWVRRPSFSVPLIPSSVSPF
jgi:hypothetical protein